jgi:hypothetical protein
VSYAVGRYADAVHWYDQAEQIPWARPAALFEGAYARFLNEDVAGALERLNRPELASGFWPEAPVLEATIHYFRPPDREKTPLELVAAERALTKLDRLQLFVTPLEPYLSGPPDQPLDRLLESDGGLPPGLLAELRSNRRLMSMYRLLRQTERERAAVLAVTAWQTSPFSRDLAGYLESNAELLRKVVSQLVKNRLTELWRAARGFADTADVIRLEIATQRYELADVGMLNGTGYRTAAADALKRVIPKVEDGSPQRAELLFRLAELYRDIANEVSAQPRDEALFLGEAARLLATVLREYPRYERRDEVLFNAGSIAEQLHDRDSAVARYQQLLLDFPSSRLANEARKRLDVAH